MFKTDTTANSGDKICVTARITPINGDCDSTNNNYGYCFSVVNSHDPNIKEVYPLNFPIGYDEYFTYTIHFQNTGSSPAKNIRLLDSLDKKFDLSTFEVINYSHSNSSTLIGNILQVSYRDIMLDDSIFNEKLSHGFFQYRIKTKKPINEIQYFKNRALIYFDYNPPINTNTVISSTINYNNYLTIPDSNFVNLLHKNYPSAMVGNKMDTSNIFIKKESNLNLSNSNIYDLNGIQYFVSLKNLDFSNNNIHYILSKLPDSITYLDCSNNNLFYINNLPVNLKTLKCNKNKLNSLPSLPNSLSYVDCRDNIISALPKLPNNLKVLLCNNNKIYCFPVFSDSLQIINLSNNPFICLQNYVKAMGDDTLNILICPSQDACTKSLNLQNELLKNIFIYPNPAENTLTIERVSNLTDKVRVCITSINGQELYHNQLDLSNKQTIDISAFASGVYFVNVQDETTTDVIKVVKK